MPTTSRLLELLNNQLHITVSSIHILYQRTHRTGWLRLRMQKLNGGLLSHHHERNALGSAETKWWRCLMIRILSPAHVSFFSWTFGEMIGRYDVVAIPFIYCDTSNDSSLATHVSPVEVNQGLANLRKGGTIITSLNLPAQSFYQSRKTLLDLCDRASIKQVIFYCGRPVNLSWPWCSNINGGQAHHKAEALAAPGGCKTT